MDDSMTTQLSHLEELESEGIHIFREVAAEFERPVLLFSGGKDYRGAIESAGLEVREARDNPQYHFISESAQGATETFGVKSISVFAVEPA